MPVNPKLMPGAKKKAVVSIYDYDTWCQDDPSTALYRDIDIDDVFKTSRGVEVKIENLTVLLPRSKVVLIYTHVEDKS